MNHGPATINYADDEQDALDGDFLGTLPADGFAYLEGTMYVRTENPDEFSYVDVTDKPPVGVGGVPGPQGPKGDTGPQGEPGQGFTFQGAYDSGAVYDTSDVVTFGGSSYIALVDGVTAIQPGTDPASWAAFAIGGSAGPAGPAGPQGPAGTSGGTVGVFDVQAYGAVANGSTSDRIAIQNAINAAAAAGGGVVQLMKGTHVLGGALTIAPNYAGMVTIRGQGRSATKIKLTANTAMLGVSGTVDATYQRVTVEDLTIDANSLTSGHVVFSCFIAANFDDWTFRRIDTINVGGIRSGSGRRNIDFTVRSTAANSWVEGATIYTITNITIQDCRFGVSGGGGNTGVLIEGFVSSGDTGTARKQLTAPWISPTWIDNILIERVYHKAQDTVPTALQGSAGFQVGQAAQCGQVVLRDCVSYNAADVNYEMDSVSDLLMEGCYANGCVSEGYYIVNLGGEAGNNPNVAERFAHTQTDGSGTPAMAQNIRLINCIAVLSGTDGAIRINDRRGRIGNVIMEGCKVRGYVRVQAAPPKLTIRDLEVQAPEERVYTSNNNNTVVKGLQLELQGGKSDVLIDGYKFNVFGTLDSSGFTGNTYEARMFQLVSASSAHIEARHLTYNFNPAVIGTGAIGLRHVVTYMSMTTRQAIAAGSTPISTNLASVLDTDNTISHAQSDSNGVFPLVGQEAIPQRYALLVNPVGDFGNYVVRESTDHSMRWKFKVGNTLAGFKVGAFGRMTRTLLTADSTTFVEAYVCDDGTKSYLCLDKVIRNTRTSLLGAIVDGGAGTISTVGTAAISTAITAAGGNGAAMIAATGEFSDRGIQLASRLTTGGEGTIRILCQGNTFRATYGVTAFSAFTATGDADVSATLSASADLAALGSPRVGYAGWSAIFMNGAARLGNATTGGVWDEISLLVDPLFEQVRVVKAQGHISANSYSRPLWLNPSTASPYTSTAPNTALRIEGKLRYRKFDHSGLSMAKNGTATPVTDASTLAAYDSQIEMADGNWIDPPQPAAITVGSSPFTYTNADHVNEDVSTYGGTVSEIAISRDSGATFNVINSTTGTTVRLGVGDQLKVTYSVAPTMRKVPIL